MNIALEDFEIPRNRYSCNCKTNERRQVEPKHQGQAAKDTLILFGSNSINNDALAQKLLFISLLQ